MRKQALSVLVAALGLAMLIPSGATAAGTTVDTTLVLTKTIKGSIIPKSIHTSTNGVLAAFNMMYKHSVTLYDATTMKLIKTIPDSVNLSKFGYKKYGTFSRGAPVEGAFSPDNRYLYVSNYSMYGKGFGPEGKDNCSVNDGTDRSFVYRINMFTKEIDNVYQVGSVPKYVVVTPDNKYVLVTNWCSYDMSVISTTTQKVERTMYIGRYPRGMAVSPDSKTAYVAEMGSNRVHKINLLTWKKSTFSMGSGVRSLVLSPDGKILYATLNAANSVAAYDLVRNKLIKTVKTGQAPRSIAISTDGTALYAMNYFSETISKIRTSDMKVVQSMKLCEEAIGVAFEPIHQRTWVACYSAGKIIVFDNK